MIPGVVELVNDWTKRSRSVDAARMPHWTISNSSTKYEELQSMTFWDFVQRCPLTVLNV
jgi:hypothetical protein